VRLTSPAAGALFRSSLTLAADASDDVAVARVEFRVDGRLVSTDTSAPYAVTWKVPRKLALGSHEVAATAFDAAGKSARATATVTRVSQSTAIAASNGSGRLTAAGRNLLVAGRLPGRARAAEVQLRRQGAGSGRWRLVLRRRAKVHGARYRLRVTATPGRWQVRVVFRARGGRRTSVSHFETLLI
jgi:hypothetical protein